MSTSEKEIHTNIFNKQFKNTEKEIFSDGKHLFHINNMHECRKMKRLKSHRERNQMRGCGHKASKSSSQRCRCHRVNSKDTAHFHSCCHDATRQSSRRDSSRSSVVPVSQEPSIITENRLIGHQGLFNHEVKSIDIERLLSEQRKMEKRKAEEKKNASPRLSPAPRVTSPICSMDCTVGDSGILVPFEDRSEEASKAHSELGDTEKDFQGIAHTLEPRPRQQQSPESLKSTLSANHSKLRTVRSRKGKHVTSVKDRGGRENTKMDWSAQEISSVEHTPKNQDCAGPHSQTHSLSPVRPSGSNTAHNFDRGGGDPGCSTSQSACAMAASLCHSLRFPFLKKGSLVEESRQVLLNALRERHGGHLQENLRQVWSCLSFDPNNKKGSEPQEEPAVDEDETFPRGMHVEPEQYTMHVNNAGST